ncbi:hypothetical protein DL98DRAFT_632526 [Cadophora sp. DSE1049]|nr:hypothetical protein DL98DRAFT_632526 [Cadophora sp. DSE1049]
MTVINADNYAWMSASRAFAKQSGWPDQFPDIATKVSAFNPGNNEVSAPAKINPPANCVIATDGIASCAYVGMTYDEWLLDRVLLAPAKVSYVQRLVPNVAQLTPVAVVSVVRRTARWTRQNVVFLGLVYGMFEGGNGLWRSFGSIVVSDTV